MQATEDSLELARLLNPNNLNPQPSTLHPTPYTLNPKPYTLKQVTEASLELARLMHQHTNDTMGAVKVLEDWLVARETWIQQQLQARVHVCVCVVCVLVGRELVSSALNLDPAAAAGTHSQKSVCKA